MTLTSSSVKNSSGSKSVDASASVAEVGKGRRIYLASSWRNEYQPLTLAMLREAGHEVYDFRNPAPGNIGFAWSEIDPDWLGWKPRRFVDLLDHPTAISGFGLDFDAMEWADTFVLDLPCGRSAHLEAGWAIGQGKPTAILIREEGFEPELMYRMAASRVCDYDELLDWLDSLPPAPTRGRMPAPSSPPEGQVTVSSGGDSVTPQNENLGGEQSSPSAEAGSAAKGRYHAMFTPVGWHVVDTSGESELPLVEFYQSEYEQAKDCAEALSWGAANLTELEHSRQKKAILVDLKERGR